METEVAFAENDAGRLDGSDLGGIELVEREEVKPGAIDRGLNNNFVNLGLGSGPGTVERDAGEEQEVPRVVVPALFDDLRVVGEDGREESVA